YQHPFCGNRATTFPILHVTLPKGHFLQRIFRINVAYDLNRSFARRERGLPFPRSRTDMRKLLPILDYVVLFVAVAGSGVA
ncbi:hypothetical protein SB816_34405, partial [Achromobacter sp. SIMBA_011]|uniref:hypothetical protein n=1 Tax=Achromobacter sp. SIMBA_011 TaxID=3085759 RepID=UPI003977FE80